MYPFANLSSQISRLAEKFRLHQNSMSKISKIIAEKSGRDKELTEISSSCHENTRVFKLVFNDINIRCK